MRAHDTDPACRTSAEVFDGAASWPPIRAPSTIVGTRYITTSTRTRRLLGGPSPRELQRQVVAVGVDLGADPAAGAVVPDLAVALVAVAARGAGEAVAGGRQGAALDGDGPVDGRRGAQGDEVAVLAVDDLALLGDGDVPEAD